MAGPADRFRQLLKSGGTAEAGRKDGKPVSRRSTQHQGGPRWADPDIEQTPRKRPNSGKRGHAPFVTPYYLWGTLALLAAGIAVGGLGMRFWPDGRSEGAGQGTGFADPLVALQEGARDVLLAPTPELSAELKRSFLGKPDALCAELRAIGLTNPGWRKAPFKKNRWQCASDLVELTTPSVDFGSTTLFFLLRGPSEDKIDYLRLKLVVEDTRQKQIGLDAVWLVIDALAGRYGWTVPDAFREAVAQFKRLEITHRGVQLSVAPEDPKLTGDPLASQRMNIIMNFGEPDLIRPADRFEQAPPLESGWSVRDRHGPARE